jgi:hypothetical protein
MTAHVTIVTDGEVVEDLGMLDTQEILDVARDRYALDENGDPECIDNGTMLIVNAGTAGTHSPTSLNFVVSADNPTEFEALVLALATGANWPRPDSIVLML